ncbi:hypothetical protein BBJ28_00017869 [Nothophytophthora sp. Chile5]|nr:hypothetical protein BBJ28_00017869 [Nothophytophthora sp. Chile5]
MLPLFNTMQFELSSWPLDEYLAAVKHDDFFRSVMAAFDLKARPGIAGRRKVVEGKHSLAGGSARAMYARYGSGPDGNGEPNWIRRHYVELDEAMSRLRFIFLQVTHATPPSFVPEAFIRVLEMLGEEEKQNVGAVGL